MNKQSCRYMLRFVPRTSKIVAILCQVLSRHFIRLMPDCCQYYVRHKPELPTPGLFHNYTSCQICQTYAYGQAQEWGYLEVTVNNFVFASPITFTVESHIIGTCEGEELSASEGFTYKNVGGCATRAGQRGRNLSRP